MFEKLLPIGSVVLLKGGKKKTVIIGVMQFRLGDEDKIYDYQGVPYPEGYMGDGSSYLFNHDQIEEIVFRGYEDTERRNYVSFFGAVMEQAEKTVENSSAE